MSAVSALILTASIPTVNIMAENYDDITATAPLADYSPTLGGASDFSYKITDGKVTITDYKETYTDLIIPETIEDYPVTEIHLHRRQSSKRNRNVCNRSYQRNKVWFPCTCIC